VTQGCQPERVESESRVAANLTGVVLIRVWYETCDEDQLLRIRITTRADLMRSHEDTSVATSVDDAIDRVRSWLLHFERRARSSADKSPGP
jgi:hypothetical protein